MLLKNSQQSHTLTVDLITTIAPELLTQLEGSYTLSVSFDVDVLISKETKE